MRRRSAAAAVAIAMVGVLLICQSALASTEVGSRCVGSEPASNYSVISTASGSGDSLSSTFPGAGVVTSWTFNLGLSVPPGLLSEQLKIYRPTSVPGQFLVAGESPLSPVATGLSTFAVRIPVKAGDYLGSAGVASGMPVTVICSTAVAEDRVGLVTGNSSSGSTVMTTEELAGYQNPIVATVEPDADGDGFGDETQDKCPTDASTQGSCPVPPPPAPVTTLSTSSTAKRGLVNVIVTSNVQATVTVGGTVKLGKGKPAKLTGGSQVVVPGSLAKFVVLFPAELKAKLKALSSRRSLSLKLAVTAPGAAAKGLTVKIKGQAKPKPRRHKR